jgi:hypothetical protein
VQTTIYLEDIKGNRLGTISPHAGELLDRLEQETGWVESAEFSLDGRRYTIIQVHFGENGSSAGSESRVVTAIPSQQAPENHEPPTVPA